MFIPGTYCGQSEPEEVLSQHAGGEATESVHGWVSESFAVFKVTLESFSLVARGRFSLEVCRYTCEFEGERNSICLCWKVSKIYLV